MSMEVHQNHVLRGGAKSGRTVISLPEMPSPAPNHRENSIFTGQQKTEPPSSMIPQIAATTPHVVRQGRCCWKGGSSWRSRSRRKGGCYLHDIQMLHRSCTGVQQMTQWCQCWREYRTSCISMEVPCALMSAQHIHCRYQSLPGAARLATTHISTSKTSYVSMTVSPTAARTQGLRWVHTNLFNRNWWCKGMKKEGKDVSGKRATLFWGNVCLARARRMPGALPFFKYLVFVYLISSPKFILTLGSPPSRPH